MGSVTCQERVGGRAGTAAPQGVVCELPNPPDFPTAVAASKPAFSRLNKFADFRADFAEFPDLLLLFAKRVSCLSDCSIDV